MDKKLDQTALSHQELGDQIHIPVPGSAIALIRFGLVEPQIVENNNRYNITWLLHQIFISTNKWDTRSWLK